MSQVKSIIPIDNSRLKENLAIIYYNQKDYNNALNILNGIEKSLIAQELISKIKDSLSPANIASNKTQVEAPRIVDPLNDYQSRLQELIVIQDFSALESLSIEAMEMFPVHPFFYYCNGLSLNNGFKYQEALIVLETAIDYWLEDDGLLNKIYEELVIAHKALGNNAKVNLYTEKLKSRSQ